MKGPVFLLHVKSVQDMNAIQYAAHAGFVKGPAATTQAIPHAGPVP